MKLSINWLNSYFDSIPNWDDIFHKLTMAGIEVEDIEVVDNDKIVELKITPNRGDALSVLGILREISVLTNYVPKMPGQNIQFKSDIADKMSIEVREAKACPNYQTLIIKNVNNKATLPDEIIQRLNASGNRSISPVVDITNYVMLELGQPLHAFDMNKVGDKLRVRFAHDGENLHLLAEVDAKLNDKTLLICDCNDNPAAIAGVMGGLDSGVTDTTTNIVLESAFFAPEVIIGKTKYYGISSDSAYRFERGVDPDLQNRAIKYAAQLITKYCGGQIGEIAALSDVLIAKQVNVDYSTINRLIGVNIPANTVDTILTKLGFTISHLDTTGSGKLNLVVPGYRFDISIEEDIIEEIARVYGYDNIDAKMPVVSITMDAVRQDKEAGLKTKLVNLGYSEIVGYAFLEEKLEFLLGSPKHQAIRLQNPIANLNVMRTSLIADLVKTLEHNLNRGHKRMRIFELARVFHGETEDMQPLKLSGLAYGNYTNPGWSMPGRLVDFYDLRNDIEILLSGLGKIQFVPEKDNLVFHSGRCAKILLCNKPIGVLGQLHPKFKAEFNLPELPYVFELDMAGVSCRQQTLLFKEVSKFQKVSRDLAFLVPLAVNVGDILDTVAQANVPYLTNTNVFDIYQGDKLAHIKLDNTNVKSIAINFLFQGDKTLGDEEINNSMHLIQSVIQEKFVIQLRT